MSLNRSLSWLCWLSLALVACGEPAPVPQGSPEAAAGASSQAGGSATGGTVGVAGASPDAGTGPITVGGGGHDNAGGAPIGTGTGGSGGSPAQAGSSAGGGVDSGGSPSGGAGGSPAGGADGSIGGSAGAGGAIPSCTGSGPVVTVYAIGDSTMSVYDSKAYPRMGWAQPLGDLFAPKCAKVADKALSGRSSKSFMEEGAWKPVKDALKSGDYVLIQFGHNDEKSDNATLYTDPQTTYKEYLTTYVNDTRAKQANPVLLTSINRNSWSGTTLDDTHKGYPPAVRELAKALAVPLIDLEALTRSYFTRIGPAETPKVFLILKPGQSPNYPDGVTDNTHLQEAGARAIGRLAMSDAYARNLPLAGLLNGAPLAP